MHEAAGGAWGDGATPIAPRSLRADAASSHHNAHGGLSSLADSKPLLESTSSANTGFITVDATTGHVISADEGAAKFLDAPASVLTGRLCSDCCLPPLGALVESATGKFPPLSCVTPTRVLEATVRASLSTATRRRVVEVTLHDPSELGDHDDSSGPLGNAPSGDRGVVFRVIGTLLLAAIVISGSLGIAYASFANAGEFTAEIKLAAQCRYLLAGVATYALEISVGGTSPLGTHDELASALTQYSSELVGTRHLVRVCARIDKCACAYVPYRCCS